MRTEEGRRVSTVSWSIFMRNNAYGESPEDESVIVRFIFLRGAMLCFFIGLGLMALCR